MKAKKTNVNIYYFLCVVLFAASIIGNSLNCYKIKTRVNEIESWQVHERSHRPGWYASCKYCNPKGITTKERHYEKHDNPWSLLVIDCAYCEAIRCDFAQHAAERMLNGGRE